MPDTGSSTGVLPSTTAVLNSSTCTGTYYSFSTQWYYLVATDVCTGGTTGESIPKAHSQAPRARNMRLLRMSKGMLSACAHLFNAYYLTHLLRCARSVLITCIRYKLIGMAEAYSLKMSG